MSRFIRCLVVLSVCSNLFAEAPRVFPKGEVPKDTRLGELRHLNGYHPFRPVKNKAEWIKRAKQLTIQTKVACGVWPEPTKTPLNAVIHGKIERDDYTIEKVHFESLPGHYVTGNLYRPKNVKPNAKLPGVLCPHGHWGGGRFYMHSDANLKKQIEIGAEKFEQGGKSPLQARCVQLARMGFVVFHYDMVYYADSLQFTTHRPGVRKHMNNPKRGQWGYFSPQADARMHTMYALQTWNSVRSLDFLMALPNVDADRVAVTGASGGATQTMMITAVDNRVKLAFPAVMVSTSMQGGCSSENAPYLRVGAGNIDLAAITAPRPLGITAADDWTKELETKGHPDLKKVYAMMGVPDNYIATFNIQFKHNFNWVSRKTMYNFVNKHFKLGLPSPVDERDYELSTRDELSVWTNHDKPDWYSVGDEHERPLLKWLADDLDKQMTALVPTDRKSLKKFRRVVGGGWETIIGRQMPDRDDIEYELIGKEKKETYIQMTALLRYKPEGEEVPTVFLYPNDWNGHVVIWVDPNGKSGLFDANGKPNASVQKLIESGASVAGLDLLYQGEFLKDGKPLTKARMVNAGNKTPWKNYTGFTHGFNHPLYSQRVHDIMTMISFCRHHQKHPPKSVNLIGLSGAGHWVAGARAMAGAEVDRAVFDTSHFRFGDLTRTDDVNFVCGGASYHDLPGLLALAAPNRTLVRGETNLPAVVVACYKAAGDTNAMISHAGEAAAFEAAAIKWIVP